MTHLLIPGDEQVNADKWMYVDANRTTKGPISTQVLMRMLEKGLLINSSTQVWKQGMSGWEPIVKIDIFEKLVKFQSHQWYYVDCDQSTKGPVITRMILHKVRNGDLDGMTLVFNAEMGEWKKISEVEDLKAAILKESEEEEAAEKALEASKALEGVQAQVFVDFDDDGPVPARAYEDMLKEQHARIMQQQDEEEGGQGGERNVNKAKAKAKRSFVADDGVRYCWDDEEQDWVVDDDPDPSDDEEEEEEGNPQDRGPLVGSRVGSKAKASAESKGDAEGDDDDDDDGEEGKEGGGAQDQGAGGGAEKRRRKRKNRKGKAKGPSLWVYISGLPHDVTPEELKAHFSKVGLIAISPFDQLPKIKLYRGPDGRGKGDASVCYVAEESVAMALEVLNGGYIRPSHQVSVTRAEFQPKEGASGHETPAEGGQGAQTHKRPRLTHAQVKVAQAATQQALSWNEADDIGVKRSQALRIVVLTGMFEPSNFRDPSFSDELETDLAGECSKCGHVEKITVFSQNPAGVAIVKFGTAFASQECVKLMDGRYFAGRKVRCFFWDGVTNYSGSGPGAGVGADLLGEEKEKEEAERLDEFGDWLDKDQENLPEEFQLRVER